MTVAADGIDGGKSFEMTLNIAAKVTLDHHATASDGVSDFTELLVRKLSGANIRVNSGFLENFRGGFTTDSEDIGERRFDALLVRDFDSK